MPEPAFLAKMRREPILDMKLTLETSLAWSLGCVPAEGRREATGEYKELLSRGTLGSAVEGTGIPCSCNMQRNSCKGREILQLIAEQLQVKESLIHMIVIRSRAARCEQELPTI